MRLQLKALKIYHMAVHVDYVPFWTCIKFGYYM